MLQHGASRRVTGVVLASTFLITSTGCVPFRKGSFRGPATVTDTGVFSYYRYHFFFSPALPLDEAGTEAYTFRGLPKDEMNVQFEITPANRDDYQQFESLDSVLSVALRDDRGHLLCSGSGKLSESRLGVAQPGDDHWVLASGANAEFWRLSCSGVKFARNRTFTLTMTLADIDPRTPAGALIRPRIEGGGIELP